MCATRVADWFDPHNYQSLPIAHLSPAITGVVAIPRANVDDSTLKNDTTGIVLGSRMAMELRILLVTIAQCLKSLAVTAEDLQVEVSVIKARHCRSALRRWNWC